MRFDRVFAIVVASPLLLFLLHRCAGAREHAIESRNYANSSQSDQNGHDACDQQQQQQPTQHVYVYHVLLADWLNTVPLLRLKRNRRDPLMRWERLLVCCVLRIY